MTEEVAEAKPEEAVVAPSEEPNVVESKLPEEVRPKSVKVKRAKGIARRRWFAVKQPSGLKMDYLCMLSATLGLISLALPWVIEARYGHDQYRTLWYFAMDTGGEGLDVFGLAAGFMLVGSLLALFSRLGGLLQMGGIICVLTAMRNSTNDYSVGFFLAVAACVFGILSLILRRSFTVPQKLYSFHLLSHPDRLEINLLSILGGVIGLVCVVLPWFEAEWSYYPGYEETDMATLFQFSSTYVGSLVTWVAAVVFIAGSILALFSPLGGLGQIAGWGLFLYDMTDFAAFSGYYYGGGIGPITETTFSIGFYIGIVCALVVCASLFIRWRFKMSRRAVSWFIAWPIGQATPLEGLEVSKPKAAEEFSFRQMFRSTMKTLIVTIVVLAILVASAGLAYALPWSKLEVSIHSNYPDQRLHVAIYLDGEGKTLDYVDEGTSLVKSFSVRAGTHRVAFDYEVIGDENSSKIDGFLDWATSIKAKPLRTSYLLVGLGFSYHERPVIELTSSPYGNGERVNVTEVNEGSYSDVQWEDMQFVISDGSEAAEWDILWLEELDRGVYAESSLSPVALGSLNITLTIVDITGNGNVNPGDYFTFTTGSDQMFSSTVAYTLYVIDDPSESLIVELSFQGRY